MTRQQIIVQFAASLLANLAMEEFSECYILEFLGESSDTKYVYSVHSPKFIAKRAALYADALIAESQSRSKENDKAFCVRAEAFVNFLNARNYQTLWKDNDELFYYCGSDNPTRDVQASEVLSLFEDWENR